MFLIDVWVIILECTALQLFIHQAKIIFKKSFNFFKFSFSQLLSGFLNISYLPEVEYQLKISHLPQFGGKILEKKKTRIASIFTYCTKTYPNFRARHHERC